MNLDYGEIEAVLAKIMGKEMSFANMVQKVTKGNSLFWGTDLFQILRSVLLEQIKSHGQTMETLFLLVISAALLTTISKAFRNRQISDMSFFMIFLLLFLILIKSFGTCYIIAEKVVEDMIDFMRVLMPTYLMAAAACSYRTSAIVYYEGFLLVIYYLQKMVELFLLPAIRCYVLFSMLGYLGKEDFFSKGREGLKQLILWILKAMVGVSAGFQMIQGMISPAVDEMKHTLFSKGISSLGSVGNVAQNVTDVIIGSGELLKNGIGVAAAVVIISICMIPVVEVAYYVLFYHVLAVVAEPISDKRLIGIISQMGEGMGLLVKLLFSVCAIFLLTIAFVCVTTGGLR